MPTKTQQLESNIVATVSTAEAVLAQFEQSLLAAGFAESTQSYVRLADTLIGQRLWADSTGMASEARFAAVAAHARTIHALLLPYVDAFQRLAAVAVPSLLDDGRPSELDGSGATDPAVAEVDDPLAARVLEALDAAPRPVSTTALRAALGAPRAELVATLDRLADAGWIERRQASGREFIRRSGPGLPYPPWDSNPEPAD